MTTAGPMMLQGGYIGRAQSMRAPVLVSGSSTAGLVLALALSKRGIPVEVLEGDRKAGERLRGRAVVLPMNAVRVFERLGVREAVLRAGCEIQERVVQQQRSTQRFGSISYDRVARDAGVDSLRPVGIGLSELHSALRAGMRGVPVRAGATVSAIEERGGALACNVRGQVGVREYAALVCASAHAASRDAAREVVSGGAKEFDFERADACPYGLWSAVVDVSRLPASSHVAATLGPDRPRAVDMFGNGVVAGVFPAARGAVCLWGTLPPPEGAGAVKVLVGGPRSGSAFPKLLGTYFPSWGIPELVERARAGAPAHVRYPVSRNAAVWAKGRVALLGPAAWLGAPAVAHGTGYDVEDAWLLAQAIADAPNDAAVPAALSSFAATRRPIAERRRTALWNHHIMASRTGVWGHILRIPRLYLSATSGALNRLEASLISSFPL